MGAHHSSASSGEHPQAFLADSTTTDRLRDEYKTLTFHKFGSERILKYIPIIREKFSFVPGHEAYSTATLVSEVIEINHFHVY